MSVTICVYEDDAFRQFFPLTWSRPVATLRAGIVPLFRRAHRYFPDARLVLLTRDDISELTGHTYPNVPVNIIKRNEGEDVLFVNGRIRSWGDLVPQMRGARLSTRFLNDKSETVAVLFRAPLVNHTSKVTTAAEYVQVYEREAANFLDLNTTATLYQYLWDIVTDIDEEIAEDFQRLDLRNSDLAQVHAGAFVVDEQRVFLGKGATILPGAVIDASRGPVYIGANTRVESHAAVYGPSTIGPDSIVGAGKFAEVSIGETCRIGGEIEASIFQSYVNKYHAGFIGHSYVGSWVNFGAMTTNSDLKNNYATIRVQVDGKSIDTGSIKIGSFVGDHTKFGIGTLLNTGIAVGPCCNIFGGSLITDKDVPPFRWGNSAHWDVYQFDKAMETAARTTERRKQVLSDHERAVFQRIFQLVANSDGCVRFD